MNYKHFLLYRLFHVNVRWLSFMIVLALLFGLTLAGFQVITKQIDQRNHRQFSAFVVEAQNDLKKRLEFYEDALWGGVGLFNATDTVDRKSWNQYVNALQIERYPGINGIGYIEKINQDEKTDYLAEVRAQFEEYNISNVGEISEEYLYPIKYIGPEKTNYKAIGLDIGSERNRRTAAEKAESLNQATMTDPIVLVQDQRKMPGFLMLAPVYNVENRLQGWVYAPFIARNFIKGILYTDKYLNFSIVDNDPTPIVIYTDLTKNNTSEFQVHHTINVVNNQWDIYWESTPAFMTQTTPKTLAYIWLIAGCSLFIFTSVVFFMFLKNQKQAEIILSSAQKSLIESENKFSEAFNNAAIGIALVSIKGRWLRVNRSLCDMLGYTESELLQTNFQTITHPDDLEIDVQNITDVIEGRTRSYTMKKRYYTKAQKTIWVRLNVSLVRDKDGIPQFFVSQIENITREQLLDNIKSDFISISSHQFRTPLAAMRWNLESIIDGEMGKVPNKNMKENLNFTLESVLKMTHLVHDLLRAAKIENQSLRIKMKEFDVLSAIKNCIKEFEERGKEMEKKIYLPKDMPVHTMMVTADQGILNQVLEILLDNALHYSNEKSNIFLDIEPSDEFVDILILNQGVPIKKEEETKLFEKLVRLSGGVSKNPNGTGLGLYAAKQMIESLGGELTFEQPKPGHIVFRVRLRHISNST